MSCLFDRYFPRENRVNPLIEDFYQEKFEEQEGENGTLTGVPKPDSVKGFETENKSNIIGKEKRHG